MANCQAPQMQSSNVQAEKGGAEAGSASITRYAIVPQMQHVIGENVQWLPLLFHFHKFLV